MRAIAATAFGVFFGAVLGSYFLCQPIATVYSDRPATCFRKLVSYESSKLEKKWLENTAQSSSAWVSDPCKFIHQDSEDFVEWMVSE